MIGYKESLAQFVKDLGPTAKKVAKMKQFSLNMVSSSAAPIEPSSSTISSGLSGRMNKKTEMTLCPMNMIASDHHQSTAASTKQAVAYSHKHFHLKRDVVLALPCSSDITTTRKKAATNSCHIHPSICIPKMVAAPPPDLSYKLEEDPYVNHNINRNNRHHPMFSSLRTIPTTVGNAAEGSNFTPPQYKFDLQFLQMRLHQMKSDDRPAPPPPQLLLLQDDAPVSELRIVPQLENLATI